eukprot:TRINITY_DN1271_c0_g1_i1.p1 TRINITY_DN1271_c0_g1~~TRINITY_DN1271_c0_g1_i1.p1  ORF type:complete len:1567 (-),score=362.46 TRINITY_DN1271_c0_g1_i1:119-4819(-)
MQRAVCGCLLLFVCLVAGDITATTSFVSSLDTKDYTWDTASVVSTFDENMFVSLGCTSGSDMEFNSCGAQGSGTSSDPYCLSSLQEVITISSAQTYYYKAVVTEQNFAALVLTVAKSNGNPLVTVTAGNFEHTLFKEGMLYPLAVCGDDLQTSAGGLWDYTITITVETTGKAYLELLFAEDPLLMPLADFYPFAEVSIDCGSVVLNDNCTGVHCPFSVPATADPFFSFFANYFIERANSPITTKLEESVSSNTLATIVTIQRVDKPARVPSAGSGIGAQALDLDGKNLLDSCSVVYSNLLTENGSVEIIENKIEPVEVDCDVDNFNDKVVVWEETIEALSRTAELGFTAAQTYHYVNLAHTVAASQDWSACRELALSFLNPERTEVAEFTKECLTPPGSAEWVSDPCCNEVLEEEFCCAGGYYDVVSVTLNYDAESVVDDLTETCTFPDCADVIIRNYENVGGSNAFCTEVSDQANTDPRFTNNPYSSCFSSVYGKQCFFNSQCLEIADSFCNTGAGSCTVPCNADGSCYRGTCVIDETYGKICDTTDASNDENAIFSDFLDCILGEIDPYLRALIENEVTNGGQGDRDTLFREKLSTDTCVGGGNTTGNTTVLPWIDDAVDSQESCEASYDWCSWLQCRIPEQCSREDCENAFPARDYCGFDLGVYFKLPVGNPNVCSVTLTETLRSLTEINKKPDTCETIGTQMNQNHTFVGVPTTNFQVYSSCLDRSATTQEECDQKDWCLHPYANMGCPSYCEVPRTISDCTGTIDLSTYGLPEATYKPVPTVASFPSYVCAAFGVPYDLCPAYSGDWKQGYKWQEAQFDTEEICTGADSGLCYSGTEVYYNDYTTEANCTSEIACTAKCDGSACTSKEECEAAETCNNPEGCFIVPEYLATLPYDVPCIWTPKGCITPLTKDQCDLSATYNPGKLYWLPRFDNEVACAEFAYICRLEGVSDEAYVGAAQQPAGYVLRNETECTACGGTYKSFFDWVPGQWVQTRTWLTTKWMTKEAVSPRWERQINKAAFDDLLQASRAQRLSSILVGELYCTYGAEKELFSTLSCNCGSDQGGCDVGDSTAELTVSGMSACTGVPGTVSTRWITDEPLVFEVADDFAVSNGDICVRPTLSTVPLYLLQIKQSITLSSLFITSESYEKSSQGKQYVYNDNGVIAGQLVGDGVGIKLNIGNDTVEGLTVCITFPDWDIETEWNLRIEPEYKTIVVSESSLTEFRIERYNLDLDTTDVCIPVTSDIIVFPAIVIEEWETLSLTSAWPSEELGFAVALAVLYGLDFLIISCSFIYNIHLFFVKKDKSKTVADFLVLGFLFILTILRTIYFSGVPSGEWESSFALVIIFGDLPALLFLGAVILTGNKWGQIYYTSRKLGTDDYKKKNKILNAFSFFLIITIFIIFIILSAIYGDEINNLEAYTCSNPPTDGFTYVESISLVYKCIFAFYCMVTALFFAFFGGSFVKLVFNFTQKGEKEARTRKFLFVTTICVLALLALAAILIASTRIVFNNMAKFAIILCTEWFPITGLCFLYGLQNFTKKAAKDSTQATNRTRKDFANSSSTR